MEKIQTLKRGVGFAAAAGLGVLGLAACAGPNFDKERTVTVTGHEYDDPDTWISPIIVGKVPVMVTHYDPAHYYLNVQQCGFEPKEHGSNEQGCLSGSTEVNETVYKTTADGAEIYLK